MTDGLSGGLADIDGGLDAARKNDLRFQITDVHNGFVFV